MPKKRLRNNKHRAMKRRLTAGKKPMSKEDKEARKKLSEKHREMTKIALAKSKK